MRQLYSDKLIKVGITLRLRHVLSISLMLIFVVLSIVIWPQPLPLLARVMMGLGASFLAIMIVDIIADHKGWK